MTTTSPSPYRGDDNRDMADVADYAEDMDVLLAERELADSERALADPECELADSE